MESSVIGMAEDIFQQPVFFGGWAGFIYISTANQVLSSAAAK